MNHPPDEQQGRPGRLLEHVANRTDGKSSQPVAIAPAPARGSFAISNGDSSRLTMPYTCQSCARRKVKCDKSTPKCSTCTKNKSECLYQAPLPRRRKRKASGDAHERLAQYERILSQHGLLPQDVDTSPSKEGTPEDPLPFRFNEPETSNTGRVLTGEGKSRYVGSYLWRNLGDDEVHRMLHDEDDNHTVSGTPNVLATDPLTGALVGSPQVLLEYHPSHPRAMILWQTHVDNVEPLCKILHIPSVSKMVDRVSQQPEKASKAEECLLFAVYHFAVFSMTDDDCAKAFTGSRATLMQRFNIATRQALVNASFLKTTEMSIMQALVLFLIPCRYYYDPHTYWILTGVAVRIAQRMGLHRDGEKLGLSPFDLQMRRRLFYQIIPLDGIASQISGTGIGMMPETWDTQPPLNINDDQIWPGMIEKPEEQKGATEMIFCLARACVGKFFAKAGKPAPGAGVQKSINHLDAFISEAENEVEERYIRYCDTVDPLHFMAVSFARASIAAMRVRVRLPKVTSKTVTRDEMRELFKFTQKIMDIDTTAYAQTSVRRYAWYMRSFYLWGMWNSLIFVLTSLRDSSLLLPAEVDGAWRRVEQVFCNHGELLELKRTLTVAVGRLTLRAWKENRPDNSTPEPAFIASLRLAHGDVREVQTELHSSNLPTLDNDASTVSPADPSPVGDMQALPGSIPGDLILDKYNDFDLDDVDWVFWEQLIKDYQMQSDQEQVLFQSSIVIPSKK